MALDATTLSGVPAGIQQLGRRNTGWTQRPPDVENPPMGRYRHRVFEIAKTPRFCVLFNLQWTVIESVRLGPATNLAAAMNAAVERQVSQGWQAESSHEFGFVFLRRHGERRLMILTERDPYDTRPQSFSPFKTAR
jgi:hypothetical protein